ncbi:uncharacterized protein AB675_738 [Cyphellophora attinorum]|uniref:C2 domain-containing protein n=1 Tax=Cyphellophora attinorum TaxID=1664694 RepID=A0A0N0NS97_9EURO|nr:uncharacterized protein AB675_738 [Phialophora attinorum]KPI46001.1 hypothetical protein AB675_738 [Phialophora attinorum]
MADAEDSNPVLRHARGQGVDRVGAKVIDKTNKFQENHSKPQKSNTNESKKGPPGGFDSTPIQSAPPGYRIKITFHRAENLPFADFAGMTADPYIVGVLKTSLPKRHKQDPDLTIRTPTIHKNTNPEWNTEWIIENVPASGFYLKCRIYDEDPADHDDRLGNVHVNVSGISESWKGFREQKYDLKKRVGSKRAYTFRGCAALFSKSVKFGGNLTVSVENLGRSPTEDGGRAYTLGPLAWSRHFSPLIGRLTGTKDRAEEKDGKPGVSKYNFQAVQVQLAGPVPAELYHRYVEFKPFVAGMFTDKSLRGRILNRALHHQHARIYNFDKSTQYGHFDKPNIEMTKRFLEYLQYDHGGRIFTYVLTLDGQFRFTETGKEFGIDLLSKHTMHSDVSIYIAFSGEFFIRRLKHAHHHHQRGDSDGANSQESDNEVRPPEKDDVESNRSKDENAKLQDPKYYELIIDNDSGTYRPNAKLLPQLRDFFASNYPGLKVMTLDCKEDEEKMNKLKDEQREAKKKSGNQITYMQNNSMSSLSSSDEEQLNERAEGREHEHKYKQKYHAYLDGGEDLHHDDGGITKPEPSDLSGSTQPAGQQDRTAENDRASASNEKSAADLPSVEPGRVESSTCASIRRWASMSSSRLRTRAGR